ncbi:MAG: pyrimidine dimer DNA glycosylase [Candidatus Thermoplasmatota archaeon]|nr:pyrimidine dimer DNA glycosylase [Candidatus Thermoplasmatota archaeon]
MRIWDLPVECLCRNHLLAEHRELHAIWSIIIDEKRGYCNHPEVIRMRGRLAALWTRHEEQVGEMARRGYAHRSPLDPGDIPKQQRGKKQTTLIDSIEEQREMLTGKGCPCQASIRTRRSHSRAGKRL